MEEHHQVSQAEVVAGLIAGTATSVLKAQAKTISYRIPVMYLEDVDAMAAEAGRSRNSMLNLLLDAGIQAVLKELPKEALKSLQRRKAEVHQAVMDGADDQVEES